MDRTQQLDHVYGLLVVLDEEQTEPSPDLMDAFNLLADRHRPEVLVLPDVDGHDRRLRRAFTLLTEVAQSAEDLREALDLYAAADLVKAVIRGRMP